MDIPLSAPGNTGTALLADEFAWCAAELYVTTKEVQYYNEFNLGNSTYDVPGWGNVRTLGLLSLIVNRKSLTAEADTALAKSKLIDLIAGAKNNTVTSPYRIPGDYFYWGGNTGYANRGMLLMQAFKLTGDAGYFNAALSTLDYLLGRNATKYCFVTGIGSKRPMNIHHRVSGSDGIAEPIPGFLVGGPNPAMSMTTAALHPILPFCLQKPMSTCYAATRPTRWPSTGMHRWHFWQGLSSVNISIISLIPCRFIL